MKALTDITRSTAPTVSDDINKNYQIGSKWTDSSNGTVFLCTDNTANNATWERSSALLRSNDPGTADKTKLIYNPDTQKFYSWDEDVWTETNVPIATSTYEMADFHALVPVDNKMTGVLNGVGTLSTTHADTIYAADYEGVYRPFFANEPVWADGRVVTNYYLETTDLTNVAWTTSNVLVVTGVLDPDGTNTAHKITSTNTSGVFRQDALAITTGNTALASWWVRRANGGGTISMYTGNGVTTVDITSDITSEWFRITSAPTATSGTNDYSGFLFGTVGDAIEIWHPQLEDSTGRSEIYSPSEYIASGTAAAKETFVTENPNRLVTNLVSHFVGWTETATLTSGVTDPLGTSTAFTITSTGVGTQVYKAVGSATTELHVNSMWVRRRTGTSAVYFKQPNGANLSASPTITLTTEWQRFSVSSVSLGGTAYIGIQFAGATDAVDVWQPQLELSAGRVDPTLPSEYVTTTTGSAYEIFTTTNGNTVDTYVVTENTGTFLGVEFAEAPSLAYSPAVTNELVNSYDLTTWTQSTGVVTTLDSPGINGVANWATTITDDDIVHEWVDRSTVITADTNPVTVRWFVTKDTDETRFVGCSYFINTGPSENIHLNTKTGAFVEQNASLDAVSVHSSGNWWVVTAQGTNVGVSAIRVYVYPALGNVIGTILNTATGSCIIGQVEVHENKTLGQVQYAPPIFTSGAADSIARTKYQFDLLNHNQTQGLWSVEWIPSHDNGPTDAGAIITTHTGNSTTLLYVHPASGQIGSYDVTTAVWLLTPIYSAGITSRLILAYGGTRRITGIDGDFATEGLYDGDFSASGAIELAKDAVRPYKFRNIQYWDLSYPDAVTKGTILMG